MPIQVQSIEYSHRADTVSDSRGGHYRRSEGESTTEVAVYGDLRTIARMLLEAAECFPEGSDLAHVRVVIEAPLGVGERFGELARKAMRL